MPRLSRSAVAAAAAVALALGQASAAGGPAAGDAARGERVFQRCYACHSVDPDETADLQGPSLFRILGRPAAAKSGFAYSDAMRKRAAGGLVWDTATLDAYVADPESVVPGTLMSSSPVPSAEDRADLIAYLSRSGAFQD
ncbi:MAG: c-type cytochrome [Hyphomicrobiaceae bacterium]|nr:c-type cytochrome [Hyphomicrobiaceae bacterium]